MPWTPVEGLPFPSLGPLIAAWIEDNLVVPDGSMEGEPLRLTDDQYRFVYNLYRLNPDIEFDTGLDSRIINGRALKYNQGVYSRPKGSGKSPILGALCWANALGPVLFGGWDADGQPIGLPHPSPIIQVVGYSMDNTKNLWGALLASADPTNGSRLVANYPGTYIGQSHVKLRNKSARMEFVTTSGPSREGNRSTFCVIEESAYLTKDNGGAKVAETLRRNAQKMSGMVVQISNSFVPGQQSTFEAAWNSVKAYEDGTTIDAEGTRIYMDHREAPADTDLSDGESLMKGLQFAYQGSPWVDLHGIMREIWNPQTTEEDSRRFYLNQITAAVDAWLSKQEWENAAKPSLVVENLDTIALGFDGSIREDSTALVGCRVSDGHLFVLGCWEKPEGPAAENWEVDREAVDLAVQNAFGRFDVAAFYADPMYWSDYIDKWAREHGNRVRVKGPSTKNPFYWAMNRNLEVIYALDRFHEAVLAQTLSHDGSSVLQKHILNARRRPSRAGMQVAKEYPTSPKKIDAAMAAVLAYAAAAQARSAPALVPDRIWRVR